MDKLSCPELELLGPVEVTNCCGCNETRRGAKTTQCSREELGNHTKGTGRVFPSKSTESLTQLRTEGKAGLLCCNFPWGNLWRRTTIPWEIMTYLPFVFQALRKKGFFSRPATRDASKGGGRGGKSRMKPRTSLHAQHVLHPSGTVVTPSTLSN